ncbi:glucosaminidase domain-containing protein [Aquihabitans daechungensis]|uniref:glucosaminidase domain-containing protein n=1 Tax=Aquihabitans daechungensis TaxID=1052257 RepID=UPI003B9E93DB
MHREPSFPPHARRAPRRAALLVAVSAVVLGLIGSPTAAQSNEDLDRPKTKAEHEAAVEARDATLALAPDDQPPSADDPFQAVVDTQARLAELALDRLGATSKSDAANVTALDAATALQAAQEKEAAAVEVRTAAIADLSRERRRLSDLTVRAYVTGGESNVDDYRAYVEGDTSDPAAGRQIMFDQVLDRQKDVTEKSRDDLKAARRKLKAIRVVVAAAKDKAERLLAVAAELTRQRAEAEQAHLEAAQEAAAADAALRSAAGGPIQPVPQEVSLIGMPRLNAEDLAGWFESSPYRPRTTTPTIAYATWFIQDGRAEGIRGDIAFAQAVLETGGFANTDSVIANNFSGIGHYDNAPLGFIFPSPRAGVRAQIQLLKGYAVKKPEYANPLVDKRLRGPAGCCQTWGDLTTVWATDPTYGPKVMLIYTSMVEYALQRRARGEGFADPSVQLIAQSEAAPAE